MESDSTFPKLVQAYKVSKFMKTNKFGVEVPQTTREALKMDEADGNNLWSQAMDAEIKSLHAHNTFHCSGTRSTNSYRLQENTLPLHL